MDLADLLFQLRGIQGEIYNPRMEAAKPRADDKRRRLYFTEVVCVCVCTCVCVSRLFIARRYMKETQRGMRCPIYRFNYEVIRSGMWCKIIKSYERSSSSWRGEGHTATRR
jgi:hypothetical protein